MWNGRNATVSIGPICVTRIYEANARRETSYHARGHSATAPHVGNALPEWYDVVSLGFYAIRSNQEKLSVCAKPRRDRPVAQVLGAEERSVTVTNWPPQAREG